MFVLSIAESGSERNFLTTDLKLVNGQLLAVVGDCTKSFAIKDVIDLVLVDRGEGLLLKTAERR